MIKLLQKVQGAFHAVGPEDLRRRPDFFVGVAASFLQQNWFLSRWPFENLPALA